MVFGNERRFDFSNASMKQGAFAPGAVIGGEVPRKQPDAPQLETHIDFIVAKKDGKLWIKHTTVIIDWKPIKYYEAGIERAMSQNAQRKS